eukprot:COSAG02_NODE_1745_length_11097_cov_12.346518_13_plen_87_part_00
MTLIDPVSEAEDADDEVTGPVCGGFRSYPAETATNGAIGPLVAPWRWAVAPWRQAVAPIGAGRWRQSALGGGANARLAWRQRRRES